MVSYTLILDKSYICTCTTGDGITLDCRDSFCAGCIARLIWKNEFSEEPFIEKNREFWLGINIKCPKCLSISEIGNSIE